MIKTRATQPPSPEQFAVIRFFAGMVEAAYGSLFEPIYLIPVNATWRAAHGQDYRSAIRWFLETERRDLSMQDFCDTMDLNTKSWSNAISIFARRFGTFADSALKKP